MLKHLVQNIYTKVKNTKQAHAQSAQFYKHYNPIWKFSRTILVT